MRRAAMRMAAIAAALMAVALPHMGEAYASNPARNVMSRAAWVNSTQDFSAHSLRTGNGVGSLHHLISGSGPGSMHYFLNGRDFGSAQFFLSSTASGSLSYWRTGNAQGSRHFWSGGRGCLSRYFWEYGGQTAAAGPPCSGDESHAIFLITMCLADLLQIEACGEIVAQLRANDPEGSRYMNSIVAFRAHVKQLGD